MYFTLGWTNKSKEVWHSLDGLHVFDGEALHFLWAGQCLLLRRLNTEPNSCLFPIYTQKAVRAECDSCLSDLRCSQQQSAHVRSDRRSAALTGCHGRLTGTRIWVTMYELPADQQLVKMPAALCCFSQIPWVHWGFYYYWAGAVCMAKQIVPV